MVEFRRSTTSLGTTILRPESREASIHLTLDVHRSVLGRSVSSSRICCSSLRLRTLARIARQCDSPKAFEASARRLLEQTAVEDCDVFLGLFPDINDGEPAADHLWESAGDNDDRAAARLGGAVFVRVMRGGVVWAAARP